jgi:hypothetical protein
MMLGAGSIQCLTLCSSSGWTWACAARRSPTVISQDHMRVCDPYFLSGRSTLRLRGGALLLDAANGGDPSEGFPTFVRWEPPGHRPSHQRTSHLGGDLSIAAFGIVNRSMQLLSMRRSVIAQGLQPILGFSYGSRQYDGRWRSLDTLSSWLRSFSSCLLVFMQFPTVVMGAFTTDAAPFEGVRAEDSRSCCSSLWVPESWLHGVPVVGWWRGLLWRRRPQVLFLTRCPHPPR